MRKILTLFERDPENPSLVTTTVNERCAWVLAGEGVATQKHDGTCVLVDSAGVMKRHQVRPGKTPPEGFVEVEVDQNTGKAFGWLPCSRDDPADRWHFEALDVQGDQPIGTYELVGPKVQGNPERLERHVLLRHGCATMPDAPRSFDALRDYLAGVDVEGIVWYHPDGRVAKIKRRDFGLPWPTRPGLEVVTLDEFIRQGEDEFAKRIEHGWGDPPVWRFERQTMTLTYTPYGYDIDLDKITTSAALLDCVYQVAVGKDWPAEHRTSFLDALNDLFDPQATLCSWGTDQGPIDPRQVIDENIARR